MSQGEIHESQGLTIARLFDRQVTSHVFQGDESSAMSYIGDLQVGDYNSKRAFGEDAQLVTGVNMRRLNARICEATVQTSKFLKRAVWGVGFHQLSKPTITFRYPGETDETVNLRAHRIRGWEALRDANRLPEYLDFKCISYDDENNEIGTLELGGNAQGCGPNTLAIAKKLLRGQESYNVYYPVLTCVRTSDEPFTEDLGTIGRQCTPGAHMSGWTIHGNPGQLQAALRLKAYWVKTGDDISTNTDGSFTRREIFTGMDDLDKDFYPAA